VTQDGPRIVAAFDFDKTLSTRDNVVPFLTAVAGRRALLAGLLAATPDLARGRRNAVKARLVRRLLAGYPEIELRAIGESFGRNVAAEHLRPDVVARAAWHREQGHERVIVSASFACYLRPVAEHLGFDGVLGTELEVGTDRRLTGVLDGPNVRGAEKVRRLDTWIGSTPATVWAYGDSVGDRELLTRADHPVRVGRTALGSEPEGASGAGRVAR
jgi:phosphatidylglycerophosphatase C